jgi:ligand-binding SRPBCC domain-containing protein
MPDIRVETFIEAPAALCFDLARDVDLHTYSTSATNERAVAGVTTGLLQLGDTVTWEAIHFGVRQRLTARITRLEQPHVFEDILVKGAFHSFTHVHEFRAIEDGTVMVDDFRYKSPLGILGSVADKLFVERYMRKFISERARYLKEVAESKARTHELDMDGN